MKLKKKTRNLARKCEKKKSMANEAGRGCSKCRHCTEHEEDVIFKGKTKPNVNKGPAPVRGMQIPLDDQQPSCSWGNISFKRKQKFTFRDGKKKRTETITVTKLKKVTSKSGKIKFDIIRDEDGIPNREIPLNGPYSHSVILDSCCQYFEGKDTKSLMETGKRPFIMGNKNGPKLNEENLGNVKKIFFVCNDADNSSTSSKMSCVSNACMYIFIDYILLIIKN
ncbi:uncharacterized protein LOC106177369 [Lingula anatina]|uniref:Uncharacterized protein LOC106177369 n=1 Tax=Lingula anatina TaxID=7574 RepID=A0A1S3JYS9_LINAN|nr:uncharacterized protein LOC106177369 [Lingula anatina]|eukprot:XP_013415570.1 uncharacterized protein LOC106177369 [Lingula anatina]